MKKFILLIIFGCLTIYGFPIDPIVSLGKTSEDLKTLTSQSPVFTEECSDLCSMVNVTIRTTFTDCPDYTCEMKDCTFEIYYSDEDGNPLGHETFYPNTCIYEFPTRAEEGKYIYATLVANSSCTHLYNDTPEQSSTTVPQGGGTVNISTHFCQ
jgi:hypothetical protein